MIIGREVLEEKRKKMARYCHPGVKVLDDMPAEDKVYLWEFMLELVKVEVSIGLGLIDIPPEEEEETLQNLSFFDVVSEVYDEYNSGCYMCADIDPNADPFSPEKHMLCLICMMKLTKISDAIVQVEKTG